MGDAGGSEGLGGSTDLVARMERSAIQDVTGAGPGLCCVPAGLQTVPKAGIPSDPMVGTCYGYERNSKEGTSDLLEAIPSGRDTARHLVSNRVQGRVEWGPRT
jgi:hypothetical protein